ncbi:hypothetical protein ACHAWO_007502 [Cyclotella atomus]|uniref:Aspartyl protease n=1 Tax=Cyclotella atomus TaxID=382360 RepID=A0ABD3P272_9STRA
MNFFYAFTLLIALALQPLGSDAFMLISPRSRCISPSGHFSSHASKHSSARQLSSTANEDELLQSIRSLKAREIKSQLESLNISTVDAFEKEELVQRLFRARLSSNCAETAERPRKKKKRRQYDGDEDLIDENDADASSAALNQQPTESSSKRRHETSTSTNFDATIKVPFQYFTLDTNKQLQDRTSTDIYIRPSPGKYAAIKVKLQSKTSMAAVEYTLLVDTACSGLVLSSQAVSRSNGLIQTVRGAASMTAASGNQSGYDVATWGDGSITKFIVGGIDVNQMEGIGGGMMNVAAINDIGALPEGLDGILGLSFLSKFACVDFDFAQGELRLYKTPPTEQNDGMSVVAEGPLHLTKLGIYTVDTVLDGRGPVKLLVDTGAASTFMNWYGVSQLGYSKTSQQIEPIRDAIGAMGADNTAMRLTHRYILKRRWNIKANGQSQGVYTPGIGLKGTEFEAGLNIDIGDLLVLESLRDDRAGGIIGADLLMLCGIVRFDGLNTVSPRMIVLQR